jgi:hypothetical protein
MVKQFLCQRKMKLRCPCPRADPDIVPSYRQQPCYLLKAYDFILFSRIGVLIEIHLNNNFNHC